MRQLILVLFVAACAPRHTAPLASPALGTSHVTETESITPPNQDAAGRTTSTPRSAVATQLLASTKQLEAGVEPEHLAHALQALASAIDAIAPGAAGDTQDVRNAADDLARAGAPNVALRTGLDVAVRAMGEAQPPTEADRERYSAATADMHTAIDAIDPTRSLVEQQIVVRAAFRAATRAVLAAQDAAPPSFDAEASTAQR